MSKKSAIAGSLAKLLALTVLLAALSFWLPVENKPKHLPEVLISARHARSLQQAGGAVLVDARTSASFQQNHLEGAINLPLVTFEKAYLEVSPQLQGKAVITYCDDAGCAKAGRLAARLRARGQRAFVLDGGLAGWTRQGMPTQSLAEPVSLRI